ncbi:siderophore-interacting protein [Devosia sp. CAU 1758]
MPETATDPRAIKRHRHDTRLRLLTVTAVTDITPLVRRVRLAGDMTGFASFGHADHIKAFFFADGTPAELPPVGPNGAQFPPGTTREMRDYTPRHWNVGEGWIDLDFVLHGDGPASGWASSVKPGDTLVIGGPRGSQVVPLAFDWYLLAGDETALPAIGRRIEELPAGTKVVAVIEVENKAEEQAFETAADLSLTYVHRNGAAAGTTTLVPDAIAAATLPQGDAYAYIAGEVNMARAVKAHLVDKRGFNPEWVKAAGYWHLGVADAHEDH